MTQQNAITGEAALARLKEGNQRFTQGNLTHDHADESWRKELVGGQYPFAAILSCSDSRVPVELIFDRGFGDLFVVRNAGNVVAPGVTGSIQYATAALRVPLVVVLGHECCGAVTAALQPADMRQQQPEAIRSVLNMIDPALAELPDGLDADQRLEAGIKSNVRQGVLQLTQLASVPGANSTSQPKFIGAIYSLQNGIVQFLE